MLTRLRSWVTGAPGHQALPTRADADLALTGLMSEAYRALRPEFSEIEEARRIFGETNDLQNELARRASDYDRFRPELEAKVRRLRSELHAAVRDGQQ